MNKQLTIAIPTKNRKKYLIETIESITKQKSFSNIEIIVCDNMSIDGTYEAMGIYKSYENIHYYRNSEELSIDDNMIKVANYVQTKYFLWLGDDDFIIEDGVQKILEYIIMDYDFILLSAQRVSEDLQEKLGCNLETSLKDIFINQNLIYNSPNDFFLNHCFHMPFGTLIVKKELYDNVLEESKRFLGTSHAYGGIIWDYLAKKYLLTNCINVILVREELIMLRIIKKTWAENATKIMMSEIPEWFLLLDKLYSKEVNHLLQYYLNTQFKLTILISRRINGHISFRKYPLLTQYGKVNHKVKYLLACLFPILSIEAKKRVKYLFQILKLQNMGDK